MIVAGAKGRIIESVRHSSFVFLVLHDNEASWTDSRQDFRYHLAFLGVLEVQNV